MRSCSRPACCRADTSISPEQVRPQRRGYLWIRSHQWSSTIPNAALLPATRSALLAFAVALAACRAPAGLTSGLWLGDLRHSGAAERMEVTIDSSGRSARMSIPGWALDTVPASLDPTGSDTLAFTAVVGNDTVRMLGPLHRGAWIGKATRRSETALFELRRLHPLSDSAWRALVGTYRAGDGHLLGIAPFSEFGDRPLIADYATGRIGPLYPIAPNRFLVGHSLIAPVFPADTLELMSAPDGVVREIRFSEREHPSVVAQRLATRDQQLQFASGPVTLSGTLTLPPGPPPYPALVLVHGSNALTRDVFGPWSRYFVGLGFAVLSYDKRGTGRSTGDWKQADFPLLAADVLAGVRVLAARRDIRSDRIGLWGASQAGWIMPLVAAQAPREIAFLVVHAGSGTTVGEEGVLYLQHELRSAGLSEASVAVGTRYQMLDDSVTRAWSGWKELQRFYESHRATESWLWPPRPEDDWFRGYYRMLMDFDPAPSWKRVSCPVLFFFGELDANVPPRESWPPTERALALARNSRVSQFVLPGANHLFLQARTGASDEYPGLSRFVPGYFERMAQWLQPWLR
jgi:pimeloyl-ACP methyl ester carboxylesterase